MPDKLLSQAGFDSLRQGAEVLEEDGHGEKVLRLLDGRILKLFRLKSRFSSARWLPYSRRFVANANRLTALGIPTVSAAEAWRAPALARTAVCYQPLPGETLRRLGVAGQLTVPTCARAGELIARLHTLGILFRSLHLGNIVLGDNGELGLIDIADLKKQPFALLRSQRLRNFGHLFRPDEDHLYLRDDQRQALLDAYLAASPGFGPDFGQALYQLSRFSQPAP